MLNNCKDCKYNKVKWDLWLIGMGQRYSICYHKKVLNGPNYTKVLREFDHLCGKEGKWWEAKK